MPPDELIQQRFIVDDHKNHGRDLGKSTEKLGLGPGGAVSAIQGKNLVANTEAGRRVFASKPDHKRTAVEVVLCSVLVTKHSQVKPK